eukprot:1577386-Amphidinium_carterae.1
MGTQTEPEVFRDVGANPCGGIQGAIGVQHRAVGTPNQALRGSVRGSGEGEERASHDEDGGGTCQAAPRAKCVGSSDTPTRGRRSGRSMEV